MVSLIRLNTFFFVAFLLAQATLKAALHPPSNGEFVVASRLFIWCDVLSMVSALLIAACVVRAKLGGSELAEDAREFSAAFLLIAMFMMNVAFTLAVYIRSSGALPIYGLSLFFTGVLSLAVLALLFRTRWSRLPSFLLGRA